MKTQMKFQKILTLATLILAALTFVFALIFNSGNLADIQYYRNGQLSGTYRNYQGVDNFVYTAQDFVGGLVVISIIFIVICAFLYITSTNSRRNYYITNYIAIGAIIAIAATVAIYTIIYVSMALVEFVSIDWEEFQAVMEYYALRNGPQVSQGAGMFIVGYVLSVIVLVFVAAWVLNLIWKLKLMKGEKALLAQDLSEEVA